MINLKVGSLIKLRAPKNGGSHINVYNIKNKIAQKLPIGTVGLLLKFVKKDLEISGFAGYETVDLLDELITSTNNIKVQFLCEEQIYETYYIFVEKIS